MINEYKDNRFNTDDFKNIKSFKNRLLYCKETLGKPIGNGSSRIVWNINNNIILKIAKNKKGLEQNRTECNQPINELFTKIYEYDNLSYQWIIAEKAYKLTEELTEQILKIPYDIFEDFCIATWMSKPEHQNKPFYRELPKHYQKLLSNKKLKQWYNFILNNNNIYSIAELINPYNLGVVIRKNKPYIVIIDSGFDENVAKNQYNIAETVQKIINKKY